MELVDVVRKLVGPINPIGESHTDAERLENLKAMTKLLEDLLGDVYRAQVSYSFVSHERIGAEQSESETESQ